MRPLLFVLFLVAVPAYGQDFYYERPNPNLFRTQDIDVTLRWSPFSRPPVVYYAPLPQPLRYREPAFVDIDPITNGNELASAAG